MLLACLGIIMGLVLFLPFSVRWVEEELEAFLLVMGLLAVTIGGQWTESLVKDVLTEPIKISAAVLIFGIAFRYLRPSMRRQVSRTANRIGMRAFLFSLVVGLGLMSSVITAIIAALVLVEAISGLKLEAPKERAIVILGCYAIGLGAVLTPIGEPLSTIATARLSGPPYHADFFFLARMLWPWVIGGILILGLLAVRHAGRTTKGHNSLTDAEPDDFQTIAVRASKVYTFVAALVLLGEGFTPLVERYLIRMPKAALYWANMISAVLDNATLAAAEISPRMSHGRIEFLLMGLLVSGGMLIPGNIPNIICAKQLKISSRDWARGAVPIGLALLLTYFLLLQGLAREA